MISAQEKKKYILKEKRDLEILELIHSLEKQDKKLSAEEKFLLQLCRTQLEDDWRKPLLEMLILLRKNIDNPSAKRMEVLKKFAKENFWKP